ncbi:hypothetical protein SAMN05216309_1833 [Nitrosomonas europaea]|nr:hypothetical protein SAMN05216310_1843 [Nitrosomonas europaea]SET53593.1 hypothetical protein SAMN05216309_1833 [Nitrosomonas europaea]SKA10245.1 hypothetical protein SAMN02745113_02697 [Nitrosomonas europaea]
MHIKVSGKGARRYFSCKGKKQKRKNRGQVAVLMEHQHEYDHAILKASKQQIARGQVLGFLIGLSAI